MLTQIAMHTHTVLSASTRSWRAAEKVRDVVYTRLQLCARCSKDQCLRSGLVG